MQLTAKDLARQTSVYGFFQLAQKIAALIVIPIYTHYLTPSEYGTLDILYLIVWLVGIVGGSKLDAAFIRYYGPASADNTLADLMSSALITLACITTGFCALAVIEAKPILTFIYNGTELPFLGFYLALGATWLQLMGSLPLAFLRARQEAALVGKLSLLQSLIGTVVGLVCVTVVGMGYPGILVGMVSAGIFLVVTSYAALIKRVHLKYSLDYALRLLEFGLPMLPAPFFMYLLNYADRFFLLRYMGLSEVGTYAMAYKFAMLVNLLVTSPFGEMWGVNQFALHEAAKKETFQKIALIYVSVLYLVALGIAYFTYEITVLAIDYKYHALLPLVPPLAVGIAVWGIVPTMDFGFQIKNKTWLRSLTTGIGAATNVGLNWLMIPWLGALGAALATLLSFCLLAWVTHYFNKSLTDYSLAVVKALKLSGAMMCLSTLAYLGDHLAYPVFTAIRVFGIFCFALYALRINDMGIKDILRELVQMARGSVSQRA